MKTSNFGEQVWTISDSTQECHQEVEVVKDQGEGEAGIDTKQVDQKFLKNHNYPSSGSLPKLPQTPNSLDSKTAR